MAETLTLVDTQNTSCHDPKTFPLITRKYFCYSPINRTLEAQTFTLVVTKTLPVMIQKRFLS